MQKSDNHGLWQRFATDWAKRNPVTNVILYGTQVAAVIYALIMVIEITGIVCDFLSPESYLHQIYCNITISVIFSHLLCTGWPIGLAICIAVFFCNLRVIKWKADGILWIFLLLFGISITTIAVSLEVFVYFSVYSLISLVLYFLSLLLPKRTGDGNATTFQQCSKPANWLITLSFIVMLLWGLLLNDVIA